MYRELPPITETAAELKQHLQHEHHGRKKPRLQMLYLLASGQAHTRQDVARLLGVSRNTVGRWLASYESGGLPALLELYVPAGKAPSLSPLLRGDFSLRGFGKRNPGAGERHHAVKTFRPRFRDELAERQLVAPA